MKKNKQYTKKQITEAIAYWKRQLKRMNESYEDGAEPNTLSLVRILEELEVFDACATWANRPIDTDLRLSREDIAKVQDAFKFNYTSKAIGIAKVLPKNSANEFGDQQYEEYIESVKADLQAACSKDNFTLLFKPSNFILLDNVTFRAQPNCAVLLALYEIV